ncbi:nicotinate-nucleotide adenylyltransferase [Caulobacter sp. 17J65-9]|uniref:nicotinate-nucleotide adenylyltransferase n=1 Tax=Caulobacter sp. 17J65-9 TaxID=2709382 RepID=UPI00320479D6
MAPLSGGSPRAPLRPGFHLEPGMRVGVFGGSFNPAHAGHAHVTETAMKRLGLDRVIWLVSPQNPLKSDRDTAPLAARMAGAKAVAPKGALVSDFETRAGTRYTIDTLRALKARFPGVRFVWIMGADNLAQFHRWRAWREIARLVPVAVVARPGPEALKGRTSPFARRFVRARLPEPAARALPTAKAPAWAYLVAPLHTVSSTAIRAGTAAKRAAPLAG